MQLSVYHPIVHQHATTVICVNELQVMLAMATMYHGAAMQQVMLSQMFRILELL